MAEMVAVLGLPPLNYLQRSQIPWEYFDKAAYWKGVTERPKNSLGNSEEQLDNENKALFLDFMTKMLHWMPESRHSAKQLFGHSWRSS